jgi:uncharacterized protein YbjT (DUF2867 family)
MNPKKVLVVGGTGHVGRQVVAALRERDASVRVLVRPGSEAPSDLDVVRGDMMEPSSLDAAFAGVDAVISTAAGYTRRRKGDSLAIDRIGNQNLALAAKRSGVPRYVLLSILSNDQAKDVPHFWAKALAENALRQAGVPFVALRPGGFLDQSKDRLAADTLKNKFMGIGDRGDSRWSYTYTADLAQSLAAAALTDRSVEGRIIDVGWSTGPISNQELASTIAAHTGRTLTVSVIPWWVIRAAVATVGHLNENVNEFGRMFLFFGGGAYIADNRAHEELLGPLPSKDDAVRRWAAARELILSA